MRLKATAALVVLLVFGRVSVVFADINGRSDLHALFAQHSVTMVPNDRTGVVNNGSMPVAAKEKDSFAASQLAVRQGGPLCRGGTAGGTMDWIKLTEPGGQLIHINVEHVTSVRSHTEIPGARAQLDLASGKFQAVQEDVEQVMRLISISSGVRESDTPDATAIR
jgi:hypothetical protein